jgi:hypothetical protein
MLIAQFTLILVPIIAYRIAWQKQPSYLWSVTGISFGLVAAPVSFGLYAMFFVPYVGFVPGMIGLPLALLHGTPGFDIATILGIRDSGKVISGNEHFLIGLINALVWGVVYGVIGFGIDRYREARQQIATKG